MDISDRLAELRDKVRAANRAGEYEEAARLTAELAAADVKPDPPKEKAPLSMGAAIAAGAAGVVVVLSVLFGAGVLLAKMAPSARPTVPMEVVERCQSEIRSRMNNPGTVKFPIGGLSSKARDEGGYIVRLRFRASNAFGMEAEMRGLCSFPSAGADPFVTILD